MSELLSRVAGAPITWGVCEVPGWGYQLAPERVLREIAAAGLRATELGPPGFLPTDPASTRHILDAGGLRLAAGFLALELHRANGIEAAVAATEATAAILAAAGADVLILAAETGHGGYESSAEITPEEWGLLIAGLARARLIGEAHGLTVALHPHYGTLIETAGQVNRLLATSDIPLCLDTGHLLVGGASPTEVIRRAGDRVVHVHLKDVDASLAARVRRREIGYRDAVALGLYRPLGEGDVDIRGVVELLESRSYRGWYVLEQDTVLEVEPEPGTGPAAAARKSLEFLAGMVSEAPPAFPAIAHPS